MSVPKVNSYSFPPQKLSTSKKNKKWGYMCVNGGEQMCRYSIQGIRQSYQNKKESYDLYNGIIDTKNIMKTVSKFGFHQDTFPATFQNYPIAVPKVDILVNDERMRNFDWNVLITNDDGITAKEISRRKEISKEVDSMISSYERIDSAAALESAARIQEKFASHNYQDSRERLAYQILKYLYGKLNLKQTFSRGMEDLVIASEEIYAVDIIGGEPVLRKCNNMMIDTVRSGESQNIEDSDIITEYRWMSPGQVIDEYWDYLTDKQVKAIDEGLNFNNAGNNFINVAPTDPTFNWDQDVFKGIEDADGFINSNSTGAYDTMGNIRVTRVVWKSMRKVGILEKEDEYGNKVKEIVSDRYRAQDGEKVSWKWISEWWEGTRIGGSATISEANDDSEGIFIKIQPRPIQFRQAGNPSLCHPGYIGVCYNVNTSRAISLMDRMKPYQYLYDIFMYRTELAFAKNKGVIGRLPIRKKPNDIGLEEWMHFAEVNGWLIEDDFNEGNKGAATGKLAGAMATASPAINLNDQVTIQQNIQMLEYIEAKMAQITGVTPQREGSIQSRETVRGVERSIAQSSVITEKWFDIHNNVKCRALSLLLATAIEAWKNDSKTLQYITDEQGMATLKIQANEFADLHFDVVPVDGTAVNDVMGKMQEMMMVAIQQDKIDLSTVLDVMNNGSMSKIRRSLEDSEKASKQVQQEQMQQAEKLQQQQIEANKQTLEDQFSKDMQKIDFEYQKKMELEKAKAEGKVMSDIVTKTVDKDRDGIPDEIEARREDMKIAADLKKHNDEMKYKQEELKSKNKNEQLDRESKERIASKKNTSGGSK